MRIDSHTHFLPEPYRDLLRAWGKSVRIEDRDGRPVIAQPKGTIPVFDGFTDVGARTAWMDVHGIDRTVISVSTPNPYEPPFTVDESIELVRAINAGFASIRDDHPDVFLPLGMVPFRDPEAAVAELDRIDDLGFAGVAVPTAIRDRKLSHPDFEPVFDRLDDLDLPVFVHPRPNAVSDALDPEEWHMNTLSVFPSETTIQLCRLLFDGFFDRHDFDVVVAHLGGALPYLAGRLERGRRQFSADGEPPERPIAEYLRRFHYDAISFHPPAIRAAVETVGADRILFGTDYPFGIEDAEWAESSVVEAVSGADDRDAILGETAARVFHAGR